MLATAEAPLDVRSAIPVPDLLCTEAATRIDLGPLRQTLVFAFAGGGALESFDAALAEATLPASSWDRTCFEKDLYLDALLERALGVRIGGRAYPTAKAYLRRAIGEPPRDARIVEFRRALLGELASMPEHRDRFERLYLALVGLRALLCTGRQPAARVRRVEILRAMRSVFELAAESFEGATSGLTRVRDFARAVRASDGHRMLEQLLDHEGHLGTLDVRVRIGADGEVRTLELMSLRENSGNSFHRTLIGRVFVRLALFVRGYRLGGGEITERLLFDVFSGLEEPLALLFQLLGDMEFYLAGLALRDRAHAAGLEVSFPRLVDAHDRASGTSPVTAELRGLYNPLLLAGNAGKAGKGGVVACDIVSDARSIAVVTGPNSGGKTRLLQAIAIAQLFAQAGLFVPAAGGVLPRAEGLFVSLFEDGRADQPEGHLGMELLRIRRMFEQLEPGPLVLIDELCSGTNPSEGEEIARLVLSLLPELEARAFVTTHLLQFAESLEKLRPSPHLAFFQVELDARELPTYRFVPGVAKTSLAHKTAARLGVTREELLALVASRRGLRQKGGQ
jgi:DNA mismatch repair protein MutS2